VFVPVTLSNIRQGQECQVQAAQLNLLHGGFKTLAPDGLQSVRTSFIRDGKRFKDA